MLLLPSSCAPLSARQNIALVLGALGPRRVRMGTEAMDPKQHGYNVGNWRKCFLARALAEWDLHEEPYPQDLVAARIGVSKLAVNILVNAFDNTAQENEYGDVVDVHVETLSELVTDYLAAMDAAENAAWTDHVVWHAEHDAVPGPSLVTL